jgi:phage gpG-like protein
MAAPAIRVEGVRELSRLLKHVGDDELPKALRAAHKTISAEVVKKALPNVPVRTGRLKGSVKALATQQGASVKAGARHAAAIHWGRKRRGRIAPRPFLWFAAQAVAGKATGTYLEEINRIIKRSGL